MCTMINFCKNDPPRRRTGSDYSKTNEGRGHYCTAKIEANGKSHTTKRTSSNRINKKGLQRLQSLQRLQVDSKFITHAKSTKSVKFIKSIQFMLYPNTQVEYCRWFSIASALVLVIFLLYLAWVLLTTSTNTT